MAFSPGARLGPYEVLSALGAGGMGEVYKARDTRLDRTVAIKVLPSEVAGDPDLRARFEREARAVAALDHPHICGIYDVGSVDGTHYLVMPHLEGQTLAARLEKGPLPLDQALKIATEIADALDKAHRQGIIHRDLKPANIMLTKAGPKLLDFGLAKLRPQAGAVSMSGMTRMATRAPETAQRDDSRHRAVHGARAGRGQRRRRAHRHLGAGRGDLRDGHGDAPVQGRHARERHRRHPQGRAATSFFATTVDAADARSRRRPLLREGS